MKFTKQFDKRSESRIETIQLIRFRVILIATSEEHPVKLVVMIAYAHTNVNLVN